MAGFSSQLIHSLIHWFLEAAHGDARRRPAAAGCGPAPAGRTVCMRGEGETGAGELLARRREARATARAGSEPAAAAGSARARPGASRSAFGPHDPQHRPVCRGGRGGSVTRAAGCSIAPPRPRQRPRCGSVSQSRSARRGS